MGRGLLARGRFGSFSFNGGPRGISCGGFAAREVSVLHVTFGHFMPGRRCRHFYCRGSC